MSSSSKSICIITARGGSKRIPRKNIKPFLGKPIIQYSIEVALESKLFDIIMVSTDDTEIAGISRQLGAEVPFMRSAKNSDDFAGTLDVVVEVLNSYSNQGIEFENVCVIYPTAPFVTVANLEKGYKSLSDHNAAIPVVAFSYPVWRSFNLKDGVLNYQWPEYESSRSQDLTPLYHDAGQWYWIKRDAIRNTLVPDKTKPIILNEREVQDIDSLEDWKIAELKYKALHD